jgi:hypothetical protein
MQNEMYNMRDVVEMTRKETNNDFADMRVLNDKMSQEKK